jgi:L-asparaginase
MGLLLHGSDTMSYSASALSFMLENLSKPVIFTGSQLPIDLRTDAKENLITAIQIASLQENGLPVITEAFIF